MGLLTRASHQHYCPGCQKGWTHGGYSCEHHHEWACQECREPKKEQS
jgi:formylmethanofuran dehydrogenase subunit E-like metal-binding protein